MKTVYVCGFIAICPYRGALLAPFPRGCETYGLFAPFPRGIDPYGVLTPGYQDLTADAVSCPYRGVQCPFHLPSAVFRPHRGIRLGFCTVHDLCLPTH